MYDTAEANTIDPNTPFDEAMKDLIYERWKAVWEAIPVAIEGVDPEGVHDVRVASRRLRAAMDVSIDAFPASWYKPLHKIAKEITRELGEVRDLDVQIEYLTEFRGTGSPGEQPGIDRLIDKLSARRETARNDMLAYLEKLERRGVREDVERRFRTMNTEVQNGAMP